MSKTVALIGGRYDSNSYWLAHNVDMLRISGLQLHEEVEDICRTGVITTEQIAELQSKADYIKRLADGVAKLAEKTTGKQVVA